MKHTCIMCKSEYHDEDVDDYYCPTCLEKKKKLAAEIDAKREPKEPVMSDLQFFDSVAKTKTGTQVADGIVIKRSQSFARARDIMGE